MEGVTWGALAAIVALCSSLCGIASFYLGRRKAATDEAKEEGGLKTDLHYIKETVQNTTRSLDNLSTKLDEQSRQREEDYRTLLVKFTALDTKHNALEQRVGRMQKEIAEYHHTN